jgi:hypothetical protein
MGEAGDDCRECEIAGHTNGQFTLHGMCGAIAKLAELIRSPAERLSPVGQGAHVICTSGDRHEMERLCRQRRTMTRGEGAD